MSAAHGSARRADRSGAAPAIFRVARLQYGSWRRTTCAEAAERSGLSVDELGQLVQLGIITPAAGDRFTPGHLRRAGLVKGLTAAGIPLDGLGGRPPERRQVSIDFLDAPEFERFSALSGVTFAG